MSPTRTSRAALALSVRFNPAEFTRSESECARLEEAGGPEPFVHPHASHAPILSRRKLASSRYRPSQCPRDVSTGFHEILRVNICAFMDRYRDPAEWQRKLLRIPTGPANETRRRDSQRHNGRSALKRDMENSFLQTSRWPIRSVRRDRGGEPIMNQTRKLVGSPSSFFSGRTQQQTFGAHHPKNSMNRFHIGRRMTHHRVRRTIAMKDHEVRPPAFMPYTKNGVPGQIVVSRAPQSQSET